MREPSPPHPLFITFGSILELVLQRKAGVWLNTDWAEQTG